MESSDNSFSPIIVPGLFCSDASASMNSVGSPESSATFKSGLPGMVSNPNGRKLVRADVNGVGRLMSQSSYFNQRGGYYTYDPDVAEAIGGYPEGAVLRYDAGKGVHRTVRSMVQNNDYNFVEHPEYIDGERWSYVDEIVPTGFRPRIFVGTSSNGSLCVGGYNKAGTNANETFVSPGFGLMVIQSGADGSGTVDGTTPVTIWATVKSKGADAHSTAALISYIPTVSSAYTMMASLADEISPSLEARAVYTAKYSSSPVYIYLSPGDEVKLSQNVPFAYKTDFKYYNLEPWA